MGAKMTCRPLCFSPRPGCPNVMGADGEARQVAMARKISEMPLFSALNGEELQHLMNGTAPHRVARGSLLFSEDSTADRFYILMEGQVKLFALLPDGRESIVEIMHPVSSFGEAAMMLDIPFPLNAEVVQDAILLRVNKRPFVAALHANHDLAFRMLANLAVWRSRLQREVHGLRGQPAWQRVIALLLSLTPCTEGAATVTLPFNKEILASRIGIRRESLSRVLATLRPMGIHSHGAIFHMENVTRLRGLLADGLRVGAQGGG